MKHLHPCIALLLLFLSVGLAQAKDQLTCSVCGKVLSKGYTINGKVYCEEDLESVLPKCANCGKPIHGNYVTVTEKNYPICLTCRDLPRCFLCTMPATTQNGGCRLPDGRMVCAEHNRTGVTDPAEAQQIFRQAKTELRRVFGDLILLKTPVKSVELVDLPGLMRANKNADHTVGLNSGKVLGITTITWTVHGDIRTMDPAVIHLLNRVPADRMLAVAAHEYAHAWHAEHHPDYSQTSLVLREGFAEWVSYKVAQYYNRQDQMAIMKNPNGGVYYTGLLKFLELERRRGVDGVLDYACNATNI